MVFLFIILFILIFFLLIITASIEIEVVKLKASNKNKEHIFNDCRAVIKLKIFNKISILKISINKQKIEKMQEKLKVNQKIEKLEKEMILNNKEIKAKTRSIIKEILKNIVIKKFDLEIELSVEDAFLTSMLVALISSILSIASANIQVKRNMNKINYKIVPIYTNQNLIKFEFSGIFKIKLIHIIDIIYLLNKKKGVKNNERTSNRRSYDYSYE